MSHDRGGAGHAMDHSAGRSPTDGVEDVEGVRQHARLLLQGANLLVHDLRELLRHLPVVGLHLFLVFKLVFFDQTFVDS